MYRVDTNAVTLVVLCQLGTGVGEFKGAYAYFVTGVEQLVGYAQSVDIDAIGAAQINDAIAIWHVLQASMVTGDLRMIQDNGIIWKATNANLWRTQRNGTNLRHDILRRG